MSTLSDDELEIPRDSTGRNVLLVLAIAFVTFVLTFAIVKIRQHYTTPQAAASKQLAENRGAPVAAVPVPTPAAVPPTPAPAAAIAMRPAAPAQSAAVPHSAVPAPKASPSPRKAGRASDRLKGEPPAHLKNELLPLSL